MKKRVAIIGGGLSGLSAACHLLLRDSSLFEVHIFESAPFLGGQCASWNTSKGNPVETGIHLDFPWYHNKDALFEAIGHPLNLKETDGNYYVCNGATNKIDTLLAGKSVIKTLRGLATFPGLSAFERIQLTGLILKIMFMDDKTAESYDHLSVSMFLKQQGASAGIQRQLALEAVTIQGLRPDDASAASFIKFLRTMYGSMGKFDSTFFEAPLADALIKPLQDFISAKNGVIHLSTKITHITPTSDGKVNLKIGSLDQNNFNHVIIAIPGYAVCELLPDKYRNESPFLPLSQLKETPIITLTLWYDTQIFQDGNVYISNRDRTHGPIFDAVADKAFHWRDWKELKTKGSIIQVLIDAADDVENLTDTALTEIVLKDLERFFPKFKDSKPNDVNILRHKNTYCGTRVNYWSQIPRSHDTGVEGLWLAGDYTDGPYNYGMESAVISGKAVASAILKGMKLAEFDILKPNYLPFVGP